MPVSGLKSPSKSGSGNKKKGNNKNSSKNRRDDAAKQRTPLITASHLH